jgi:hypothetical protein
MGERRAGDEGQGERRKERSLDLSVPQVAGSAVAAVVAAKLAANLGVYGTILGAGVVSVLGTCGGSIFQHVFRRTGRHMQEVAVQAKPRGRRAPRGAGPDSTLLPGAAGTVVTDGSTTRLSRTHTTSRTPRVRTARRNRPCRVTGTPRPRSTGPAPAG